jgi:TrfA protein
MNAVSTQLTDYKAKFEARALAAKNEPGTAVTNALEVEIQKALPFWPNEERGSPNAVLRSAIFKTGTTRRFLKNETVASLANFEIKQTGESLNQEDLTVWITALHLAAPVPLGQTLIVTGYEFLKTMGLTDGADNYASLDERLLRLKDTRIEIVGKGMRYVGNLIDSVSRVKRTDKYRIRFNQEIEVLFGDGQYTNINWNIRQALIGKPLAMWNHGYFGSHAKPYPVTLIKLHEICGSEIKLLKNFKPQLKKALDHVVRAYEDNGQAFSYLIEGDSVKVIHSGSASQKRHMRRIGKTKQKNKELMAVQGSLLN